MKLILSLFLLTTTYFSAIFFSAIFLSATFSLANVKAEQASFIIESALVYDGSNSPPSQKSVGICGAYICDISAMSPAQLNSATKINAQGLILSPGFIDPHTHSHNELKSKDSHANLNYLFQGVTTLVNGNDGGGPVDIKQALEGLNPAGVGTNYAFFVGHGSLRKAVMGTEKRFSTPSELEQMQTLLDTAMQQGALGLSSGLYYVPGSYAETTEVISLAKIAGQYGGIYDTHLRDESTFNIGFIPALQEAIDIAKAANIHLHVAHIKALGVDVWGQSQQAIALIESEQKQGVSITADQYPWQASGTNIRSALVPKWAMADSNNAFLARLKDASLRTKIDLEIADNIRRRGGGDRLLVTTADDKSWEGQTLAALSQTWHLSEVESVVKMVQQSARTRIASFNMQDEDIHAFMQQDWVVTSSDGSDGHPRKYASFPRKYAKYVKELKLISEAEFIHKSTGKTASVLGFNDRGLIKDGYKADIVIFKPDTFRARADFQNWNLLSEGVEYLFVNGQLTINKTEYTGVLAGEFVAKKQPTLSLSFPQQSDIYLDVSASPIQKPWAFLAPHENENIVNDYVAEKIMQHGGIFGVLRQQGQRHVQLRINDELYEIDPNRIFTDTGRQNTLSRLNPDLKPSSVSYQQALARTESLAEFILDTLKAQQATSWIAIHNNTNGYDGDDKNGRGTISIKRYQKKLDSGANYLIQVHDAGNDEDDLFFISDPNDFAIMAAANWNVVLQNPEVANDPREDDGSLSVLAEMQGKRYINVEAEREDNGFGTNSVKAQKAMVDLTFQILKDDK